LTKHLASVQISVVTSDASLIHPIKSGAISAWPWNGRIFLKTIHSGLINNSFAVRSSNAGAPVAVLQRLNTDIFSPQVNEDIAAISQQLKASGLLTPELIPTRAGDLWHTDDHGGVWRCITYVGKNTYTRLDSKRELMSAGRLVAKFHAALYNFSWSFRSVRPDAHNTQQHLATLQGLMHTHQSHRLFKEVYPLTERILDHWEHFSGPENLPRRIVHGDLKLSNIRFNGTKAVALIDLDTMAHSDLSVELGDAMRSWCNPASEDAKDCRFHAEIFESAIRGYARAAKEGPPITDAEWESIVPGAERISLELAARFAADALQERYFGWNPKFGTRGEHNLLRARGQYALALSIHEQRNELGKAVQRARKA
jgi:Ser/Thr protein kinase RdoA (MazF antagonist)